MARRGNRQLLTTLGECQACRWRRPRGWPGRGPAARPPHRIGSPERRSPYAPHRAADSRSRQVAAVNSDPLRSRVPYTQSLGRIARLSARALNWRISPQVPVVSVSVDGGGHDRQPHIRAIHLRRPLRGRSARAGIPPATNRRRQVRTVPASSPARRRSARSPCAGGPAA